MKLSEVLLNEYAKKIIGFAYEKTRNSYEAEDLAQEIMLQLIICINNKTDVEHISSFIYTVCCYTWSKYLRKNKKHWDYADIEEAHKVADDVDVELETENKLLYLKLRKAVATLAKTQREIIIMHYYENKTTAEIAGILDMNDNTVRWYLGNIRESLKEKINMRESNLDVRPRSMNVGIDGHIENAHNLETLMNDLLVQNIAIACYEKPLTISEISEKLNVAAAYLEKHIEHMEYMDFLRQTGKKYQTNFFIKTDKVQAAEVVYGYENAKPYAEKIYNAVMARKKDILSINYYNMDNIKPDYFLWYILLITSQELMFESMEKEWAKCNITDRPLRKDGSKYWVIANMRYDDMHLLDEKQQEYAKYRHCNGYKMTCDDLGEIHQADTFFLVLNNMQSRNTTNSDKVLKLIQTTKIIMEKGEMSKLTPYEKILVSEFIEDGFVIVKDERLFINAPVFTEAEFKRLKEIISEIKQDIGSDLFKEYVAGYANTMDILIPKNLDKDVRNYHKYSVMGGFDVFAHMIMAALNGENHKLEIPDESAAKYALTIIILK